MPFDEGFQLDDQRVSESQDFGGFGFEIKHFRATDLTRPCALTGVLLDQVDRVWNQNDPSSGTQSLIPTQQFDPVNPTPLVNPFVSKELHTVVDSSGNRARTAVELMTVDFNGNTTQEIEYDWVPFSSLTYDSNNFPNGASGLTTRRTTTNGYYGPTATGSNLCSQGYYCDPNATQTEGRIASKQIAGDVIGSRSDYCYDSPSTTGNLMIEAHASGSATSYSPLVTCSTGTLSGSAIALTYTYDAYGNRVTSTDARGNTTQLTYGSIGGQSGLYWTSIALPDGEIISRTYDLATSAILSATDANAVTTTITPDLFGRPTLSTAAGRTTETDYSDSARYVITRTDLLTAGDRAVVNVKRFDQLGRLQLTQQLEAPDSNIATDLSAGIKVQTVYYANPNVTAVSNPFRTTADTTIGWNCTQLDKLGRVATVQTFAGSATPSSCGGSGFGAATTTYSADTTTVTDEAGKSRTGQVDALGRLIQVTEDPSGLNYATTYAYDALDDLTSVNQSGQARSFSYDSLKRLTSASNPESGTTSYGYDPNGNLTSKLDARSVMTSSTYDVMNRLTSKIYTGSGAAATPSGDLLLRTADTAERMSGRRRECGGTVNGGDQYRFDHQHHRI